MMENLRKQYTQGGIQLAELDANPIQQLRAWFEIALANIPADWFETNAVTLATSSPTGDVTARIILLKSIDDEGLVFFTNYDSPKGQQLAENPRAAIVIYWPHFERQVRVSGTVVRTDRERSERYFHSRPRGSQIGAVASKQSQPIDRRESLEQAAANLIADLGDDRPVPLPDNWGGYLLKPDKFEFWQGRENRLHDRIQYQLQVGEWHRQRLQP